MAAWFEISGVYSIDLRIVLTGLMADERIELLTWRYGVMSGKIRLHVDR